MFNLEDEDDDGFVDEAMYAESVKEFGQKIKADPFKPGIVHRNVLAEDIAEAIEYLMFLDNYNDITIKVSKEHDNYSVRFEIIDRVK